MLATLLNIVILEYLRFKAKSIQFLRQPGLEAGFIAACRHIAHHRPMLLLLVAGAAGHQRTRHALPQAPPNYASPTSRQVRPIHSTETFLALLTACLLACTLLLAPRAPGLFIGHHGITEFSILLSGCCIICCIAFRWLREASPRAAHSQRRSYSSSLL